MEVAKCTPVIVKCSEVTRKNFPILSFKPNFQIIKIAYTKVSRKTISYVMLLFEKMMVI